MWSSLGSWPRDRAVGETPVQLSGHQRRAGGNPTLRTFALPVRRQRARDPHLTVRKTSRPINGLRRLKTGVQMIDNGILTFREAERTFFSKTSLQLLSFFRKYIGGNEFINGFHRWILYLRDIEPSELRRLPVVAERVARVRAYRAESPRPSTQRMADFPTLVGVDERLDANYLVIPNTSSERREYVPIGYLSPSVIANQKLRILPHATPAEFALLTSAMHMAWMRTVTGRMKSDYMYSVGVVYNTFPMPPAHADLSKLDLWRKRYSTLATPSR